MKAVEFALCLKRLGWVVSERPIPRDGLPSVLLERYHWIPPDYVEFLTLVDLCVHPEENAWFLSNKNFEEPSPFAFAWNEWEKQSIDAARAAGDSDWISAIKAFWSRHLPIAMSVRSGYAFLAVVTSGDNRGRVVYGREPEYEDVWNVCQDVGVLFDLAAALVLQERPIDHLSDFL